MPRPFFPPYPALNARRVFHASSTIPLSTMTAFLMQHLLQLSTIAFVFR